MTAILLVVYILSGKLHVDTYGAQSYEQCVAALPLVAERVPDTASLMCVNVRNDTSI